MDLYNTYNIALGICISKDQFSIQEPRDSGYLSIVVVSGSCTSTRQLEGLVVVSIFCTINISCRTPFSYRVYALIIYILKYYVLYTCYVTHLRGGRRYGFPLWFVIWGEGGSLDQRNVIVQSRDFVNNVKSFKNIVIVFINLTNLVLWSLKSTSFKY